MARRLHTSAGVSLIEALVAMAVMGVGTLAVLGAQTTLRFNSDLSKQRSEAVRIAQEQIEQDRTFGDFAGYTNDITATSPPDVVAANATFAIARAIVESSDLNGAQMKALRVTVRWDDRTGQQQQVSLVSAIHGSPPALAGSLLLPAQLAPTSTPGGRHRGIPPGAVLVPNTSTSSFSPPGAAEGIRWIFNNLTGVISNVCTSADNCNVANRRYVGGVIRFATGPLPNTLGSFDAGETPQGPDSGEADLVARIGVQVVLTSPSTATADCYMQSDLVVGARLYHCAVPVDSDAAWSGRIEVTGATGTPPWVLAESIADTTVGRYRVCRYTPVTGCQPAVGSLIWGLPGAATTCAAPEPQTTPPTPSRLMRNDDFPRNHVGVQGSLMNQNFLIRKAADGCPGDGPAPQVNTNTWHHQPPN